MVSSGVDSNKNVHPILVDSNGRPYIILDDGSGNTQPAGDVTARPVFVKMTDGSNDAIIELDDDNISTGGRTLMVICLNYVYDAGGQNWVRMTQP